MSSKQRITTQWCFKIIDKLITYGVRDFYLTAGYRCAPLIYALSKHPEAKIHSTLDERSAAFQALGQGKAGVPAALICTSGTAFANYAPAFMEALTSGVPLLALSADRPPSLVKAGGNQTIDQLSLLKNYTKDILSLPCPRTGLENELEDNLESFLTKFKTFPAGPMQINIPLEEPLLPDESVDYPFEGVFLSKKETTSQFTPDKILLRPKTLLVLGEFLPSEINEDLKTFVSEYPGDITCDLTCNLTSSIKKDHLLFEEDLKLDYEQIIFLGRPLLSKTFYSQFLKNSSAEFTLWQPLEHSRNAADNHKKYIKAPLSLVPQTLETKNVERLNSLPKSSEKSIDAFDQVCQKIAHNLDAQENIFLGNSRTIRSFNKMTRNLSSPLYVNRGVSGLEGTVSTAMGICRATGRPTTAIYGDMAQFYDLSALFELSRSNLPLKLIVLNNGGGDIFRLLPLQNHQDLITPHIDTPHNIRFKNMAQAAGLEAQSLPYEDFLKGSYKLTERSLLEILIPPGKQGVTL